LAEGRIELGAPEHEQLDLRVSDEKSTAVLSREHGPGAVDLAGTEDPCLAPVPGDGGACEQDIHPVRSILGRVDHDTRSNGHLGCVSAQEPDVRR